MRDRVSLGAFSIATFALYAWVLSVTCCAQTHVDLGLDKAKTYSVSAGDWVPATIPSVTVSRSGLAVSWATYFDRGYFFEHDVTFGYDREIQRFTLVTNVSRYAYRERPRDWAWSVGARWRVR